MATTLKIIRVIAAVAAAILYWYGAYFSAAMLGGAGHGYMLFFNLALFPAGGGLLLYTVTGLLLAFPGKKFSKLTVGCILGVQYGYVIYFLCVGDWAYAVKTWEAIPGVFAANILWFALGHAAAWWLITRKNQAKESK